MLDALRRPDQRGVLRRIATGHPNDLLAFCEEALHALTCLLGDDASHLGHDRLETGNVLTGLIHVVPDRGLELVVGRGFLHLRQRLHELLLSAVEIGHLFGEYVLKRVETHRNSSLFARSATWASPCAGLPAAAGSETG